MQLTFREIEKAFGVEEKTVYRWLNVEGLPAVKANDLYYFNSVEVLEWALKNRISLTAGALRMCERERHGKDVCTPALLRGGVHYAVGGNNPQDVLAKTLDFLPVPSHIDHTSLKEMLLSREQMGTTGVGDGIAIPHVKHPVILAGMEPIIGLFFLETPVDFNAFDHRPVDTLFVILTSSFKGHLSLLSRLAFCLQNGLVKSALKLRPKPEEILATFQVVESKILKET